MEVLPNRQYRVRLDGSKRIMLCNRKFLHKFTPVHDHNRKLVPTVTT